MTMPDTGSPKVAAFLQLIAVSEGTWGAEDPYRVCYGYRHTIVSFADHPAITGEWTGERLPDRYCRGAGLRPGCKSTAAGAYQIIRPTWIGLRKTIQLPDFGPDNQDRAALELIRQCGASRLVAGGQIAEAIIACRRQWASLPGSGYGQPEQKLSRLLAVYEAARDAA